MDLVGRVKAILITPRTEWPVIAREPGDPTYLFANYVAYLALIPAVAGFIGLSLISGYMSVFAGLFGAIFRYVLTFVMVYLLAVIVDVLAPTFGAQRDFSNAFRLAVYSYTPVWVSGIFLLLPRLGFLTILGLYGVYLFWVGLPVLMRVPSGKALPYALAVFVCALVIGIVISGIVGMMFGMPRLM